MPEVWLARRGTVGRGIGPSTFPRSRQVVAIQIHNLVPSHDKVTHEQLLRVAARIDFRQGSQLGVRTEDEIDNGAGPLELARCPIAPLQHAFRAGRLLPLRAHVEEIYEEIISQCFGPPGENTVSGPPE